MSNQLTYQHPIPNTGVEALSAFLSIKDRSPPLNFVGREDIINDVESSIHMHRDAKDGVSNAIIVQGPPGAGKTSLLHRLKTIYQDSPVVPVEVEGEDLSSARTVLSAFLRAAGEQVLKNPTRWTIKARASLSVGFAQGNIEVAREIKALATEIEQGTPLWDVLSHAIPHANDTVFLALIDEAQRICPDAGVNFNRIAVKLNDGKTAPIKVMTVFAGLSDTSARLKAVGASRGALSPHVIGALSQVEAERAICGFLDHASFDLAKRIKPDAREKILSKLMRAGESYPRHIHCYLLGLAKAFHENTGAIDLDAVLDYGHALRLDYCRSRLEGFSFDGFKSILSQAARAVTVGQSIEKAELFRLGEQDGSLSNGELQACIDQAIHFGVLQPDIARADGSDDTHLQVPIPSLHGYIASGYNRLKTLETLRDQCA